MTYPNHLIDKRVVQRYIAKGMVDRDAYRQWIDTLPDMEHNAARVLEEEEAFASDADEGEDEPPPAAPPSSPFE